MASRRIKDVRPVYPPGASERGVQGTVKLSLTIGRDGKVLSVEPTEGDPLLVSAAVEAVSHWEYSPTVLDGRPVDVVTSVDVYFSLAGPTYVSETEQMRKLIGTARRNFWPLSVGAVCLTVVVSADGSVDYSTREYGPPLLFVYGAKPEVQEWRYQPTMVNGQPVRVLTTAHVFSLSNMAQLEQAFDFDAGNYALWIAWQLSSHDSTQTLEHVFDDSAAMLDRFITKYGTEKVMSVAESIKKVPKNRASNGDLADPSALGCRAAAPKDCFVELLPL